MSIMAYHCCSIGQGNYIYITSIGAIFACLTAAEQQGLIYIVSSGLKNADTTMSPLECTFVI